ncbi:division plane positioning ATPase MipZ [Streptomyces sp. NPDC008079]|uniref:division plane positioning ATPase MipZ n=1 Tax=Streptomyces sp. NPDC008079 TaxID=3364806 RepID=UPI0036EAC02A
MSARTLPRQAHKSLIKLMMSFEALRAWIVSNGCLVIGVGILKGGTGKTTSALYMALYLARVMGLKVVFVDTDDNSQSAENWVSIRERRHPRENVPFDLHLFKNRKETDPDLAEVIEELKQHYQVVIVDIGGGDKEAYSDLCMTANVLVMPTAPSGYETTRVAPSMKLAMKAAKFNTSVTGLHAYVLMVKTSKSNRLADEQRDSLEVALQSMDQVDAIVPEAFQISNAVHYPRSWEQTPSREDLKEFGFLLRFMMKGVAA